MIGWLGVKEIITAVSCPDMAGGFLLEIDGGRERKEGRRNSRSFFISLVFVLFPNQLLVKTKNAL